MKNTNIRFFQSNQSYSAPNYSTSESVSYMLRVISLMFYLFWSFIFRVPYFINSRESLIYMKLSTLGKETSILFVDFFLLKLQNFEA